MLEPIPHGVPVGAEKFGDLLHRVATRDFDEAGVRVPLCHGFANKFGVGYAALKRGWACTIRAG